MPITISKQHMVAAARALPTAIILAAACVSAVESHRTRSTFDALAARAAVAPQPAKHAVCRASKLDEVADEQPGDVRVTVAPCPNADDGQCANGVPISVAANRCAKGKL